MTQTKTTLLAAVLFLSVNVVAQERSDTAKKAVQDLIQEFDTRLKQNSQGENVGSITAAIVDNEKVLWTKSYGFIDKDRQNPASTTSLYLIGSISKSITGMALAKLVENNTIRLDDRIDKYVPEISAIKNLPGGISITFRHLATHTSGLSREADLPGAAEGLIDQWEEKLLECLPMTTFKSETYEKFSYSNIGYGLLGLAMSRAADKPFDKLIKEFVFDPLQMTNSGFELTNEMKKNLAVSHVNTRDYNLGRGYKFPNGGVYSNIQDMVNFAMANLQTRFKSYLTSSALTQVQSFLVTSEETNEERYGYGLGVTVWTDKNQKKWVYHNGIVAPGYSASFYCDLVQKNAIIILRNDSGSNDIAGLADEFLYRLGEIKKSD
jgi:D-alanyl-D-alanine carboxypeptidase